MPKTNGRENNNGFDRMDFATPDIPDYVVLELRYEAPIAFNASHFEAPPRGAALANKMNDRLAAYDIAELRSHFGFRASDLQNRVEIASSLPPEPDPRKFVRKGLNTQFIQGGFVQVVPKKSTDTRKLARDLHQCQAVWQAYVAPRPVPTVATGAARGTRNFEPAQGYLHAPPNGIGAIEVWRLPGATGEGVTICDIEGNWNRAHEDLPRGIKLIGGTLIDEPGWKDHGTAVLGQMVAQRNPKGAIGISHGADAMVHSAFIDEVFNTAKAIHNALNVLRKGDVILIELAAKGPNGKDVALQYWDDIFSAIRAATEKGITVVESAGNGNENFDLPIFKNTGLQKDSGAIVVGAGVAPMNQSEFDETETVMGPPRSRISFSNYGEIVNVQGWGENVTTLGYGDAQGGPSQNRWYTFRFSGTSSASPIVAGSVACLQGRARAKFGAPLSPRKVRQILMYTGTPQEHGPHAPLKQHIGPLPNLPLAMKQI